MLTETELRNFKAYLKNCPRDALGAYDSRTGTRLSRRGIPISAFSRGGAFDSASESEPDFKWMVIRLASTLDAEAWAELQEGLSKFAQKGASDEPGSDPRDDLERQKHERYKKPEDASVWNQPTPKERARDALPARRADNFPMNRLEERAMDAATSYAPGLARIVTETPPSRRRATTISDDMRAHDAAVAIAPGLARITRG